LRTRKQRAAFTSKSARTIFARLDERRPVAPI
jgi:hypothetical protein